MKLPILSLLALPATIAFAQDLSKPVDYTTRAKPFTNVLVDLSKKTGVELVCTPDLDDEPLILRLQNVPLKEAMDRIAYVFAGEWKKKDNQYRLERGKAADDLHTAVLKTYADDFVAGVQQAAKNLAVDQPYTSESAKGQMSSVMQDLANRGKGEDVFSSLWQRTPASRLLVRVLQKIDPMSVADMPYDQTIVFSNEPTGLQHLLSMDLSKDFDQYEQEQNLLNAELDKAIAEHKGEVGWMPSGLRPASREKLSRILVSIGGVRGRYEASIYLIDASRHIIGQGSVDVNWISALKASWLKEGELMRTQKVTASLGPIALDILANIDNVENFHYPKAETKAAVLSPTQTDPLAIATSDVVLGLAEKDNVNVAFLPPDDSDSWCYKVGKTGKVSLAAYEEAAAFSKELEITEDNGWLVGAPIDPLETGRERLARSPLEEFLNTMEWTRKFGIDIRARFEADARPDSNKILADDGMMALYNSPYRNDWTGNEASLALFGTLNDSQRKTAVTNTLKVPATQLSDQQVDYLHQWLLHTDARFAADGKSPYLSGDEKSFDEVGEPTEVLGPGLPDGAYLEVTDRTKPTFDLRREAGGKFVAGCDIEGLGRLSAQMERPDLFPEVTSRSEDYISTSTSRHVTVRFVVGNLYQVENFDEENSAKRDAPTVNLATLLQQLSPEMQQAYTNALEKSRAEFASQKPLAKPVTPPNS